MFFELDGTDVIYGKDGSLLYRVIAKEEFYAVCPDNAGMIKGLYLIRPGDLGGYAGSRYCLEDVVGIKAKPWVFPYARIHGGSILAGASSLCGDTEVSDNSIVEGGCIISDSIVSGSRIMPSKFICMEDKALISCMVQKSNVQNISIKCDNIRISNSSMHNCIMDDLYGNVRVENALLDNIRFMKNTEIVDTAIEADGIFAFGPNKAYNKGEECRVFRQMLMVKHENSFKTHEQAYNDIYDSLYNRKGIYKNVKYCPA